MPQKHNPVDATSAIASAQLAISVVPVLLSAMAQEHERAVGGWQAEWAAIPALFRYIASAIEHVQHAVSNLQVDIERMSDNLALTKGLVMAESLTMALATHMGKQEAHHSVQVLCEQAVKSGITLRQAAIRDKHVSSILSTEDIDHALNPNNYLGSTATFIERALASYHEIQLSRGEV